MQLDTIGTLIATRELDLSPEIKVTILLGKPEPYPDGKDFYCPYQILGLGREKVFHAGGVDAIQAILMALTRIGTDLYSSKGYKAGKLSFFTSKNLGFPVPHMLEELLPDKNFMF